jgi:hypothetical protein
MTAGRRLLLLAGPAILALSACAGEVATPTIAPSASPTSAPTATPETLPPGPLSDVGLLARATYATPVQFRPAFEFELRADGWRSATVPGADGFVLVVPNLARADAIIAAALPVAATVDEFEGELSSADLLGSPTTIEDRTVGGVPARVYVIVRHEPADAFRIVNSGGEVTTSIGGALDENRIAFIAAPDQPFLLLLSQNADGGAHTAFVFASILNTLRLR